MRQCAVNFLKDIDNQLEYDAVHDINNFWHQCPTTPLWESLNFNGTIYRCQEEILTEWGKYFKLLYTPSEFQIVM